MGLFDNIISEQLAQLSLRGVLKVDANAIVRDVVDQMKTRSIGAAIIVDQDDKPLGMFNEKILLRLLATSPQSLDDNVESHMTRSVVCINENESIVTLIRIMQDHKLRWICVVDDQGKASALTGLRGVIEYVSDYFARSVAVQPLESRIAIQQKEGA